MSYVFRVWLRATLLPDLAQHASTVRHGDCRRPKRTDVAEDVDSARVGLGRRPGEIPQLYCPHAGAYRVSARPRPFAGSRFLDGFHSLGHNDGAVPIHSPDRRCVRPHVDPPRDRPRFWADTTLGSVSFAVASIVGGFVLASSGPDAVFGAFLASTACLVAALFLLPPTSSGSRGESNASLRLLQRPTLLVVFLAAALVLASHSTFNSFGSIHLRAAGYPNWSIGLLWALATSAEVAMFWAGPFLARLFGPYGTLLLAASAAVCRWSLMSLEPGIVLTALSSFCMQPRSAGAILA